MTTDLKAVPDHPVNVLREGMKTWDYIPFSGPATVIRTYEKEHDVTFAALDNVTLEMVRKEYEEFLTGAGDINYIGGQGLADAVRDLLGLDD